MHLPTNKVMQITLVYLVGGSISVQLLFKLTGLDSTKLVLRFNLNVLKFTESKPVKPAIPIVIFPLTVSVSRFIKQAVGT